MMTLLLTLLFVLALLVLLAGGLIHPCVIPPDAPRTFPGRQGDLPRPAPGNRSDDLALIEQQLDCALDELRLRTAQRDALAERLKAETPKPE